MCIVVSANRPVIAATCDSGAGLGPSIGAHVAEQTTFTSEFSYRRYGGAFCYHFPQFIIYFKELEYADPVVVTAFFTKRTSLAVAHFANTADKPLGKRSVQRSGQRAWLHAKVPHSVYHADGVAGVHRSQRQPSGHRGADGYSCALPVPDFPYHDHVRVLPQDRAQAGGESKTGFRVDLCLATCAPMSLVPPPLTIQTAAW